MNLDDITMESIEIDVKDVIAEIIGISNDHISIYTTFEELNIDSVNHLAIIFNLEEIYQGISVSDSMAEKLISVDKLVNYINNNRHHIKFYNSNGKI